MMVVDIAKFVQSGLLNTIPQKSSRTLIYGRQGSWNGARRLAFLFCVSEELFQGSVAMCLRRKLTLSQGVIGMLKYIIFHHSTAKAATGDHMVP